MGMASPHPGTFIRIEALEESGLSVAAAARVLGVQRATLSDLVNGKPSLSPEMALRVEKAFGLSMDLLLRMQACTTRRGCGHALTRSTFADISRHDRSCFRGTCRPETNRVCVPSCRCMRGQEGDLALVLA
ncbi:MAG: HigA family addiction module antidote protein [Boseongicola sp. SB0662_bin_57]|nr:HigA family addiction module antidote protein [Boseongicola sp. SB0662_bin_57]